MLAIIPAKGYSEGIPGKNLAKIDGKPLIVRCIETALSAHSVSRVIVSSDSAEIIEASHGAGAETDLRPEELCQTTSSSESVLHYVLGRVRPTELTILLQCTAPLMTAADINGTVEQCALSPVTDAAFAAARFHGFLWKQWGDRVQGWGHTTITPRRMRQEARQVLYKEAGSVYVMRTEGFLGAKNRFFGRVVPYLIPEHRLLEIDEPEDLEEARRRIENRYTGSMIDAIRH